MAGGAMMRSLALSLAAGTLMTRSPWVRAEQSPAVDRPRPAHFATSCAPVVRDRIDGAVDALHSFWFAKALDEFNAAIAQDPRCAMAYWGIAMTHWGLRQQPGAVAAGAAAIDQAARLIDPRTSEREAGYVSAARQLFESAERVPPRPRILAYIAAMEQLTTRYPDDREAVLFYALGILDSVVPTDKTYATRLKAAAVLEREITRQPNHPGVVHYTIHAYDVPALAERALSAARRYAELAPDVPHALHMPSHVFTRLGHWEDSLRSNLRSAEAARREGPAGTAERLHALDYAVYAQLQLARDRAARQLVVSLSAPAAESAPPHAHDTPNAFALAAIPARYALERRAWRDAAQLDVRRSDTPYADAMTHFARALGLAHTGRSPQAMREAEQLTTLLETLTRRRNMYWAEQVDIQRLMVLGWIALTRDQPGEALRLLRHAADREDATEKAGTTPGPLLPARELLGEALLDLQQPEAALQEYETALASEPNRFRTVWGAARAAEIGGDRSKARRYYTLLLEIGKSADQPERNELHEARTALRRLGSQ